MLVSRSYLLWCLWQWALIFIIPTASVYTEMNAISKGASLGIYKQGRDRGSDAEVGGSQPYVELMGRR